MLVDPFCIFTKFNVLWDAICRIYRLIYIFYLLASRHCCLGIVVYCFFLMILDLLLELFMIIILLSYINIIFLLPIVFFFF